MKTFFNVFGALLMTAVILYSSAYKSWIRFSYEINRAEIIEKFCINKEATTFECNGKCYLKTQLEKADTPKPVQKQLTEESRIVLFNCSFSSITIQSIPSKDIFLKTYSILYHFCRKDKIFHPPELS